MLEAGVASWKGVAYRKSPVGEVDSRTPTHPMKISNPKKTLKAHFPFSMAIEMPAVLGNCQNLARSTAHFSCRLWKFRMCFLSAALFFLPGACRIAEAKTPLLMDYEGRLTVDGVNPSAMAEFKFVIRGNPVNQASTAAATAVIQNSKLVSVQVDHQGAGYISPPEITIVDIKKQGFGAHAEAVMDGSKVDSIQVLNAGADYTDEVIVVIEAPPPLIAYQTLWTSDGSAGSGEPQEPVGIPVEAGFFRAVLGDSSVMQALSPQIFSANKLELQSWVRPDGAGPFLPLSPTQKFLSRPYSIYALAVEDGAIGSDQLAEGAVTESKVAANTLNGARFGEALGGMKFSLNSLTGHLIAEGSLDGSHIWPGAIQGSKIADGAVSTSQIADGAVDVSKIPIGALRNHPDLQHLFLPQH